MTRRSIIRTAAARGLDLLVAAGLCTVLAFALHLPGWISDYALFTALRLILSVAGGLAAGLIVWTAGALWLLAGRSDSSSPQADFAPCGEATPSAATERRGRGGRFQTSGTRSRGR